MNTADIKSLAFELRPLIEAELDRAEILKAMASAARDKGIDWAQLKKLVKAQALDARDGGDKRVAAIIEKADFAASYADILGFASKMNKNGESCSSSHAQDERPAAAPPAPVQQSKPISTISVAAGTNTAPERPASNLREALKASLASDDLEIPHFLDRRASA